MMPLSTAALEVDLRQALVDQLASAGAAGAAVDLEAWEGPLAEASRWLGDQPEGRRGFLSLDWTAWELEACQRLAARLRSRCHSLLVLGMGGSALGTRALVDGLCHGNDVPSVHVLDTVDPLEVDRYLSSLDPHTTAVCAVSKSGGTLETTALLRCAAHWLQQAVGPTWFEQLVVITGSEDNPLREAASALGAACLPVSPEVGGRYSVLSAVGLFPAAFAGLDLDALLRGAERGRARAMEAEGIRSNPAWALAAVHAAWADRLRTSVILSYRGCLRALGLWTQQLWTESLAKSGAGDGQAIVGSVVAQGPQDQHSLLQLWMDGPRDSLFLVVEAAEGGADREIPAKPQGEGLDLLPGGWLGGCGLEELLVAQRDGTTGALVAAGRPVVRLRIPSIDAESLGEYFVVLQTAVALLGRLWAIDPFDQPAVEDSKQRTARILGKPPGHGLS